MASIALSDEAGRGCLLEEVTLVRDLSEVRSRVPRLSCGPVIQAEETASADTLR